MKQTIFAPNQNHHVENTLQSSETQQAGKSSDTQKQEEPFFTQTPQEPFFNKAAHPKGTSLIQSKEKSDDANLQIRGSEEGIGQPLTPVSAQNNETIQRTYLEEGDPAPKNGADIEAPEIEWWKKNPYIRDDKGVWRRVTREVVNNQRGERGESHQVDPAHLREGTRKTFAKAETKIFKVKGTDKFLKVAFNYDMIVTAFYMTSDEAKRAINKDMSEVVWGTIKDKLPTVG